MNTEIKTDLIKNILNTNISVEDIEKIKNEYEKLGEYVSIECLKNTKKISAFNKNKNKIIAFVDANKNLIDKLFEYNILYDILFGYEIKYKWSTYKLIINDAIKVGKEKVNLIIDTLNKNGFSKISFVENDFDKLYYEKVNKKFNSEEYEIDYYFSDGVKEYLAYYYSNIFPVKFKDAKIILNYKDGNLFYNNNEVFLKTFDIDIENLQIFNSQEKVLENICLNDIKKFTTMCQYIRSLEKTVSQLSTSINILEKLLENKDIEIISKVDLDCLKKQKEELNKTISNTYNKYYKLGYSKEKIDLSLEYLADAEWNASIDID